MKRCSWCLCVSTKEPDSFRVKLVLHTKQLRHNSHHEKWAKKARTLVAEAFKMRKYCKHYLPAVSLGFRRSSSARSGARGPPSYFILTRQSSESTLNRFRPKWSPVLFLALHSKLAHLTPSSIRDAGLVALHRPGHRTSFYSFRTKASAVAEEKN